MSTLIQQLLLAGTKVSKSSLRYMSALPQEASVSQNEVRRFMEESLAKAGAPKGPSQDQAAVMLEADRQGHFSHGMNRLTMYVNDILTGECYPAATPTILNQNGATAWVDGNKALGATIGNFCMDLAIEKAKQVGVGWVVAKRSNHFGIAGWYTMKALEKGMIGMAFTNASPMMAPTRSKTAALGTNPISFGAPAEKGDRFFLDMATTAVAFGKIEIQSCKEQPIPEGWAQGPDGHTTTDPDLAIKTACLMPLGGAENTSGYKGFGLGAMVEILCGITAGSFYGPNIRFWSHLGVGGEANLGQCFIAMDPSNFAPGFEARMSDLLKIFRNLEPVESDKPVLVAGDKEAAMAKKTDQEGLIRYHVNQIKACNELSEKLKIKPIAVL